MNNVGNQVRFPEIKFPIYHGDRNKFEEFWAVLYQMVHINIAFSPLEKLLYLINSLTDKAAEAIKGIAIVQGEYTRKFLWQDKNNRILKCTMRGENLTTSESRHNDIKRADIQHGWSCRFCLRQGHKDAECKTYSTPEERSNSVKNRRVCWKCFSLDHASKSCTKPNCPVCGSDHHRLLCLGKGQVAPNTSTMRESSSSPTLMGRKQQKRVSFDQSNNIVHEQPKHDHEPMHGHTKENNST
uniref:CCHC-type domain-containing protein n=1 Tax=Heterorhabditis bacteriophora TaxID=37862 RepID=A0A1I7WE05_HETBA